jgi:predicted NAD-dependent protein-ADP-ribosyltransferase YbiA (DUF1768 family)
MQAREALIGYALQYREQQAATDPAAMYGYLPLPDLGESVNLNGNLLNQPCTSEGCAKINPAGISGSVVIVGRFPWKTVGTGPLRDSNGECLWYIVSAGHKSLGINPALPMNWDTLGQLDIVVANGTSAMQSVLASAHERPIAIIFSPGPPLSGQNRNDSTVDTVSECGGNYNPANYLDPNLTSTLRDYNGVVSTASAYFPGSTSTDTATTNLAISIQGMVQKSSGNSLWQGNCPSGANCAIAANDKGLTLTADTLFGVIRKNHYFRDDINSMLDRIVSCLRDEIFSGSGPATPYAKIADDPCYSAADVNPLGYYPNYREMTFVVAPAGPVNANGDATCAGALLFAGQRDTQTLRCPAATPAAVQQRSSLAERNEACNYLEGPNLTSYASGSGTNFSGADLFAQVSDGQTGFQDIVRCIPASPSFFTPTPAAALTAAGVGPLASYSATTRTLTLGQEITTTLSSTIASALSSCAWIPETHAMGAGLRSYFSFRINDTGLAGASTEGFTFALVDGDNNSINACGAAGQHLGYSGNNLVTPFIAPPKIAFEIDTRREGAFAPTSSNTLRNGRNDPSVSPSAYRGGHVAIDYWGGETSIDTGLSPPCSAPRIAVGDTCHLPQEEDDNVHGQTVSTRSGFPSPPANPAAPIPPLSVPPDTPAGLYKLDPSRSQIPVNQDLHVRVELNRALAAFTLPQVRVATTANLDLATPGTAIDGVILSTGDRVLVKDQTTPKDNGLYVWHGAAIAMTRTTDGDSSIELAGLLVEVQQGTRARSIWRQTATNPTLGTDPIRWTDIRVKLATQVNINLASPGASINDIRMANGDRVLVKAQAASAENGIYVWNGAASAMTRAADADTAAELAGIIIQVQQGTDATAWWRFDGATWARLSVRVAAQTNLTLSSPGANIDGIAPVAGDRVLAKAQTITAQNGLYIWNGAASPMTRAPDADAAAKLAGLLTHVQSGTDTGRAFRQTSLAASGTLGTGAVQWTAIDPSPKFLLEIWILPDSPTDANKIAAMKNTTRPMGLLYPSFVPQLRDAPVIGYPFRNVRLGFTIGQRTTRTDQTFAISNTFTTWLE